MNPNQHCAQLQWLRTNSVLGCNPRDFQGSVLSY